MAVGTERVGPAEATAAAASRLSPLDRWTLGYLAVASAALLATGGLPVPGRGFLVLAHALLLAAILAAPAARAGSGLGQFLGEFYPLIVDVALYTELGVLNAARGLAHDALVQGWEQALFGGQPSRDWIRAQPWPLLSWTLHAGYLSYYFILAGAPLGLWISGRREAARRALLLMMATFYVCYTVFLLFPVAGPRYTFPLAQNAATAIPLAVLTQRLLDGGAAWGTAFPSSHVAVALVAAVAAWQGWAPLGRLLLPAAVLLALGTVYGQFHYALDALCGAALAGGVLLLAGRGPAVAGQPGRAKMNA